MTACRLRSVPGLTLRRRPVSTMVRSVATIASSGSAASNPSASGAGEAVARLPGDDGEERPQQQKPAAHERALGDAHGQQRGSDSGSVASHSMSQSGLAPARRCRADRSKAAASRIRSSSATPCSTPAGAAARRRRQGHGGPATWAPAPARPCVLAGNLDRAQRPLQVGHPPGRRDWRRRTASKGRRGRRAATRAWPCRVSRCASSR